VFAILKRKVREGRLRVIREEGRVERCEGNERREPTTTWPRYVGTQGAPLAADCSTNQVKTVPACPQVDRRPSASVFDKPPDCRRRCSIAVSTSCSYLKGIFVVPRTCLKLRERAFTVAAPQIRDIVFQQTSKRCVLLLHSSALWNLFCSGRHTMFDLSAFICRFYSQTVPVILSFSMPDIVMRRRSICRRCNKQSLYL